MNARRVFALVALALALMALDIPQAAAQNIDQAFYYKLSTQFRGIGRKLDVFNGGPKNDLTRLEPNQDVPGQFWRFRKSGDGTFRLSTELRGEGMCLDIFNGGPNDNQPHLAKCANLSGQSWRLTKNADGTFRLSTLFRGPGMCLDIFNGGPNDNQPHLANCANLSGQLWTLTKTSNDCFLEYPELELSTNLAENSMRPVALGRKNWIHIGSQQAGPRVAAILSIVETCRRINVPVRDYLAAVLPGLANTPVLRLAQLTPTAWSSRILIISTRK